MWGRWQDGDFATAEFFDPDVVFVRVGGDGAGTTGVWHGVDEMWNAIIEWLGAWEDVRFDAGRYFDLDERVLVLATQSSRGRRSGVRFEREIGHLFTIHNRKIVRWENFWEPGEAFAAAGVEI